MIIKDNLVEVHSIKMVHEQNLSTIPYSMPMSCIKVVLYLTTTSEIAIFTTLKSPKMWRIVENIWPTMYYAFYQISSF